MVTGVSNYNSGSSDISKEDTDTDSDNDTETDNYNDTDTTTLGAGMTVLTDKGEITDIVQF